MSDAISDELTRRVLPFQTSFATATAVTALLSKLVHDAGAWVESSWAVAMAGQPGNLRVVSVFRMPPDRGLCVKYAEAVISGTSGTPPAPAHVVPHMVVPVTARGELRGVIALGPKQGIEEYSEADHGLVRDAVAQFARLLESERLSRLIASHLEVMNRTRADLRMAHDAQTRFFPASLPPIEGLDYHGQSAPSPEVGSDFFDFIPLSRKSLVASIGDVSGRGITSALLVPGLQASLRGLITTGSGTIADVLHEVNRAVCGVFPRNSFATGFYAELDPMAGQLRYVSAGHEPVLLVRRHGEYVQRLESTGTVLGLSRSAVFQERSVMVDPGDILIAFTDGISEAVDSEGHEFRESGILDVVRRHPMSSAADLVGAIMDDVGRFTGGGRPSDDKTVIAMRFVGPARRSRRGPDHSMEYLPVPA